MMEKAREGKRNVSPSGVDISVLPEERISNIVALTSPKDACRACAVSPIFRAAAESNAVWERFLPSDYEAIIARSSSSSDCLNLSSKKQLYLSLTDNPILIDDSYKSFFLDKSSGKKCYLLAARDLSIVWGSAPQYWRWISLPESRFLEVAELKCVWWFDIGGKIPTSMLSPKTNYATYLVFKLRRGAHGFKPPPKASVGTNGEGEVFKQTVCLGQPAMEPRLQDQIVQPQQQQQHISHPKQQQQQHISHPKLRKDGWFEIELGEFFNEGGDDDELQIRLMEVDNNIMKTGLIVEGIEIRPTKG